jgi:hypothetical protein
LRVVKAWQRNQWRDKSHFIHLEEDIADEFYKNTLFDAMI